MGMDLSGADDRTFRFQSFQSEKTISSSSSSLASGVQYLSETNGTQDYGEDSDRRSVLSRPMPRLPPRSAERRPIGGIQGDLL
jgi:hypothetical protein